MSRASPQMRDFAKRIINYETAGDDANGTKTPEAFQVFEKLRPQLAALMGNGGFRALLSRAIALARPEVPWLRALHVKSDGALGGLVETQAQLNLEAMAEGNIVLLARLLGLLFEFIGQNLTVRLMLDLWPNAPLHDLDLVEGNSNEDTK